MSACGRLHQLDALAAGEVSASVERDLRAHTHHCALCRHELNWLETEQRLARRRAGRDEIEHLWRQAMPDQRPAGSATRLLVGLTAALLLVLNTGLLNTGRLSSWLHRADGVASTVDDELSLQSFEAMSRFDPPTGDAACSRLQPGGLGFHCGSVPASFIASR